MSVCFVATVMSTAFEALDIAVRYLTEEEKLPTPLTSGSIAGHTLHSLMYFLCLECKIVDKNFGAHIYENL
jgi:Iap family predicted aminopeptidase